MLKSCPHCGGLHRQGQGCPSKPKAKQDHSRREVQFRNTKEWRRKRGEIRERDRQMCQACIRNLPGTLRMFHSENTSVHHIRPLSEYWRGRLDNKNLLLLCDYHHQQAEKGALPRAVLLEIASEQERRLSPPGGAGKFLGKAGYQSRPSEHTKFPKPI